MKNVLFALVGCALLTSCTGSDKSKEKQTSSAQKAEVGKEVPAYLYKVLSMEDWAQSCKVIHLSSMDADFIHFSTEEQLSKILEKYWANACEYLVLKVQTAKLTGNLVLEANQGGTMKYYHLYKGSIPLDAIVELKVHKK